MIERARMDELFGKTVVELAGILRELDAAAGATRLQTPEAMPKGDLVFAILTAERQNVACQGE